MYRPNKKRGSKTSKEKTELRRSRIGPRWGRGKPRSSETKKSRQEAAVQKILNEMGVDRSQLARSPQFTDMFRMGTKGGLADTLNMLRYRSDVDIIAKFLTAVDSVDQSMQPFIPWEAFVAKAAIDPVQFVGAAILALRDYNVNLVKIMAVTHHPHVLKVRIKEAMKPGGWRDRNSIDLAMKFMPSPQGATFIFPAANDASELKGTSDVVQISAAEVPAAQINPDDVFPDLVETQKLIGE